MHLSDWISWNDRSALPDEPGVYVIADETHATIYIGRTWGSGGIRDRIRAFHRSATTGGKGHAGGVTFNRAYGGNVEHLHVRVHRPIAVNPNDAILRPYIEYAERRLIWEHVERHGALPACNSE